MLQKKIFYIAFACTLFSLDASSSTSLPDPEEEPLFLQRILEFWEEGEKGLVKKQIHEFLTLYPNSLYADQMRAILAEYALEEENYTEASLNYTNITDPTLQRKLALNHAKCLHLLGAFSELIEFGQKSLATKKLAESAHREEMTYLLGLAYLAYGEEHAHTPEKSRESLEKAERLFASLADTSYYRSTLFPLATIAKHLGDQEKAVDTLLAAARVIEEKKEEYLFEAALLQARFSPEKALETFSQVYCLQGEKRGDAAYHKMLLLFELERYEQLLLAKELLLGAMDKKQRTILHFFLGRAYEFVGEQALALASLTRFLDQQFGPLQEVKEARAIAARCAFSLKDLPRLSKEAYALSCAFPRSLATAQAYLLKARLETEHQNLEAARNDYLEALNAVDGAPEQGGIAYEYAYFLYQHEYWRAAKKMASRFLDQSSDTEMRKKAWKMFANAAIFGARAQEQDQQALLQDLDIALQQKGIYSDQERCTYLYYSAKALFEMEAFSACTDLVQSYLKKTTPTLLQAPSYLLLAESALRAEDNYGLYCSYAEKALNFPLPEKTQAELYLKLFNFYLRSYKNKQEEKKRKRARSCLFSAYMKGAPLQENNLLWLFQSLTEEALEQESIDPEEMQQICSLFAKMRKENFPADTERSATIQMAALLEKEEKFAEMKEILNCCLETCSAESPAWKAPLFFRLGKAECAQQNYKEALRIYEKRVTKEHLDPIDALALPVASAKAALPLAKTVEAEKRKSFLVLLKTLVLQKKLSQEPLHLEAAHLYIDWSVSHLPAAKQAQRRRFLLQKMRNHFSSDEDILSKEYQFARTKFPHKERIYLSYMDLFELEEVVAELHLTDPQQLEAKEALLERGFFLLQKLSSKQQSPYTAQKISVLEQTLLGARQESSTQMKEEILGSPHTSSDL